MPSNGRDIKITQGALMNGVEEAAKHQPVTVIPATRLIVPGWRAMTAHDGRIGMLDGVGECDFKKSGRVVI